MSDITVRDDESTHQYLAEREGQVLGFASYTRSDGVTTFEHTVVHPGNEGQGIASTLVRAALDAERAAGRSIVPVCSFVVAFVQKHPEYADLVS